MAENEKKQTPVLDWLAPTSIIVVRRDTLSLIASLSCSVLKTPLSSNHEHQVLCARGSAACSHQAVRQVTYTASSDFSPQGSSRRTLARLGPCPGSRSCSNLVPSIVAPALRPGSPKRPPSGRSPTSDLAEDRDENPHPAQHSSDNRVRSFD